MPAFCAIAEYIPGPAVERLSQTVPEAAGIVVAFADQYGVGEDRPFPGRTFGAAAGNQRESFAIFREAAVLNRDEAGSQPGAELAITRRRQPDEGGQDIMSVAADALSVHWASGCSWDQIIAHQPTSQSRGIIRSDIAAVGAVVQEGSDGTAL